MLVLKHYLCIGASLERTLSVLGKSISKALCAVGFRKEKLHSPWIVTHSLLYRQPNYIKIITFKDKPVAVSLSARNVT